MKLCGEYVLGYRQLITDKLSDRFQIEFTDIAPDFVISDCFNSEFLQYSCVRILLMGENITPDFNLYDYAVAFDHLEYGDRYLRVPLYAFQNEFPDAMNKHLRKDEDFLNREKFCNFIFSDSALADRMRVDIFNELGKYKRIDSGGALLNNIGYRVKNKMDFMKDYKFSIAFENSSKPGYVTEKILHAFAAGTIPIYWGATDVCKDFNPKSFINVHEYKSLDEVYQRVIEIDTDENKYLAICKEPIFTEGSLCKKYYDNPDIVWDFIAEIFKRGPEAARRIYNHSTGYNKEYTKIIKDGWIVRNIKQKLRLL